MQHYLIYLHSSCMLILIPIKYFLDPLKTSRGFLSLKAYRLSNTAMKLYKEGEFSLDM